VSAYVAQVKLELEPADLQILLNGSPTTLPADHRLVLDIGSHTFEFGAPGFASKQRSIEVRGGEVVSWAISLRPEQPARANGQEVSTTSAPVDERGHASGGRPKAPSRPRRRLLLALGGIGAGLGVASFAAAGAFSAKRSGLASDFKATFRNSDEYNGAYLDWDSARTAPYGWAAAGAALSTLGAVSLVSAFEVDRIPWWVPALSGALWAGMVSWGVADVVQGDACLLDFDQRDCVDAREQRDRGSIVLLSSVPLIALPITYLIRRALRPKAASKQAFDLRPEVSVGRLGLLLFHRW
jgi:hypothetical protein